MSKDFEIVEQGPPEKGSGTVSYRAKYLKAARLVPGSWVKVGPFEYYPSAQQSYAKKYGFDAKSRKEGDEEIYLYVMWPTDE